MDNIELLAIQEEDQNSLEHYGVKGQKWGQRNYQNPDGTYTELGKERRRVAFIKEKKAKKESDANAHQNGIEESIDTDVKIGGKAYKDMTRKELRQAKKRARHNEALRRERREFNREKKAALESGDIAFISQNISKFTNDELDQAMVRYNKMQNLKAMENANKKDSGYYADKAIEWLNRGAKASSAIANISNSFNDMSKKSAERRKTQIEADKAGQELDWLRNPQSKPLTKKEELELEKQKTELQWLKDPKSKPMTEKEELDLQWLKDPKSKPKTRKEEIEAEKAEKELEWFYDPDKKPLSVKEKIDLKLKEAEAEQKEEFARSTKEIANQNEEKAIKERIDRRAKEFEEDQKWEKYISTLSPQEAWEKTVEREEKKARENSKFWFGGQSKKSPLTGWFSKKNKEDIKGTDYDLDDKRVNLITRKYLDKLKSSPKDYWKENEVRNDQWKKDLKKHDSDVIDKWVKDMKKKYMKEQKLDAKVAEEKAEAYVDSWLDAYDDGDV